MQAASRSPVEELRSLLPVKATADDHRNSILIGLLGRGIGSSRSPLMHEREGARLGMRYRYRLIDFDQLALTDDALGDVVAAAEELGFTGLNVTHPFKQSVIPFVTDLSSESAAIGAVNTLVFSRGRRTGHNTDSWGFAESFRQSMSGCSLSNVLLLGAGGAGAAVAYALLELGVEHLAIFDISTSRAAVLAERLNAHFGRGVTAPSPVEDAFETAVGVVNATPIGMTKYPGLPLAPELLSTRQWVAEIIYFPAETALLQLARARGCRTVSGLGMAVNQAIRAFELFTGIKPDRAAMMRHFEEGTQKTGYDRRPGQAAD